MKITLRKAAVLQNAINDVIKQIDIKTDIALTEFHAPESEIARARQAFAQALERRDQLIETLYNIRRAVSDANHTAGINGNLTAVAALEKQIQFYSALAGKGVRENADVLAGKLRKISESKNDRLYGYNDTVNTSVFTEEDLAKIKSDVAGLKKSKQQLQDLILELNVRTEIDLSDAAVAVLQAEGLL